MKIIFLDFDGVLNNQRERDRSLPYSETLYNKYDSLISPSNFLPTLNLFTYMFEEDIKLVISSDWRCGAENQVKQLLQLYFGHYIIDKIFYGTTPILDNYTYSRGDEINLYINGLEDKIKKDLQYLVIDDLTHNNSLYEHPFFQTDECKGLTQHNTDTIKWLLGEQEKVLKYLDVIKYKRGVSYACNYNI